MGSPTLAAMTECPAAADAPEAEAPAPRRPALSPSRAADFKQCPLLYRFRAIDRLPELPGRAQVRGTLVHAVLERLYDLPPADRHPAAARALVGPEWSRLQEDAPELVGALFAGPDDPELAEWLASAGPLLDTYFRLEDPRRLEPAARELLVETELPSGLLLRGYVDRLDIAATGQVRIVDYKTGAAPRPVAEARALFQMKFYALVLLQLRGAVPAQLQLLYLTDGESLTYEPDEAQLLRFARTLEAIWAAILAAAQTATSSPTPAASANGAATSRCARPGAACRPPTRAGRALRPRRPRPTARAEGHDRAVSEPFYLPLDSPDGERFHATTATTGPWFADAQHAGPPTALLVRALERCAPQPHTQIGRITVDVLGPIPAGDVTVRAAVERPGRSVTLLAAELAAGGRVVLRARAWRLAEADTADVATSPADGAAPPLPPPAEARLRTDRPPGWLPGFLDALEWRWLKGWLGDPGPGTVWGGSGCRWSPTRSPHPCSG